jgi:hypothetical protein
MGSECEARESGAASREGDRNASREGGNGKSESKSTDLNVGRRLSVGVEGNWIDARSENLSSSSSEPVVHIEARVKVETLLVSLEGLN